MNFGESSKSSLTPSPTLSFWSYCRFFYQNFGKMLSQKSALKSFTSFGKKSKKKWQFFLLERTIRTGHVSSSLWSYAPCSRNCSCWILEFMSGHVITLTTCPKHQNYPNFFLSPKVANVIDKVAYIQRWWRLKCSFWEKLAKRDVPHILRGSRTHPAPILSLKYSEPTSNWIFLANQYFFKSINDTFQNQTFLQISRTCLEALRCFSNSLLKKNLPPPAKCFQPTQLICLRDFIRSLC